MLFGKLSVMQFTTSLALKPQNAIWSFKRICLVGINFDLAALIVHKKIPPIAPDDISVADKPRNRQQLGTSREILGVLVFETWRDLFRQEKQLFTMSKLRWCMNANLARTRNDLPKPKQTAEALLNKISTISTYHQNIGILWGVACESDRRMVVPQARSASFESSQTKVCWLSRHVGVIYWRQECCG